MRRDTTVWLLAVAVLGMVLFVGCGKSRKQAQGPGAYGPMPGAVPGQMPGAYGPMPGAVPGQMPGPYDPMRGGMPGQMPGAYGPQQMQPAAAQPTQPEEAEPAGPSYQERYEQGELTAEELRKEHELQRVERELGYPVGPSS